MRKAVRDPFAVGSIADWRNQDAYLETLEESGRAVQGLADLLTERVTPVYRKYATKLGLGEEAELGRPGECLQGAARFVL